MFVLKTYSILNMYDFVLRDVYFFKDRLKAEEYAKSSGREVVEFPDDDCHCTIEPIEFED